MPETITLSDVNSLAAEPEDWPPIESVSYQPQTLNQLIRSESAVEENDKRVLARIVRREELETLHSVRHHRRPRTILHALLLEDGQSRAQLAALTESNPLEEKFDRTLYALREVGLILVDSDSKVERYRLAGIPSEPI